MCPDNLNQEVAVCEIDDSKRSSCPEEQICPAVEALLFAHGEPISVEQIANALMVEHNLVSAALAALQDKTADDSSGIEVCIVAGKYQIRTKHLYAEYIQQLKAAKPRKLSPAALETLAIIAYRQPVVKSEVEKIRGVDVSPTLKTLLERGLIKIAGQQATPGQPSLYATTEEFLKVFGLADLSQLPNLREVEEIESSVGEQYANNLASAIDLEDCPEQEESVVEQIESQ